MQHPKKKSFRRFLVRCSIVLLIITTLCVAPVSALSKDKMDYILDEDGNMAYIPECYEPIKEISYLGEQGGTLNAPKDLFISENDHLFIADTGNNRIVELDENGNFLREITSDGEKALSGPLGLFVTKEEEMYIADTGNARIVKLDATGKKLRDYGKPESELLSDVHVFNPSKVCVSETGDIYILMGSSFMKVTEDNVFNGYVGSEDVGFSLSQMLIRMFASEAQRAKIAKVRPSAYSNFTLGSDGFIYAVSMGERNQIKEINTVGNNIYPEGQMYAEYTESEGATWVVPQWLSPILADIAVDQNGIITIADKNSSKLYQYDQEGNLLTVFGGKGDVKGYFGVISSIAVDSKGRIYVLDDSQNNIQIFQPTGFIQNVHKGISLYNAGKYEESKEIWESIIRQNSNYPLAQRNLGDIYYKNKDYLTAMEKYKQSRDTAQYAIAYGKYLRTLTQRYFGILAFVVIALVLLAFWGLGRLKKKSNRYVDDLFGIEKHKR